MSSRGFVVVLLERTNNVISKLHKNNNETLQN